jgi:hypothetical protein
MDLFAVQDLLYTLRTRKEVRYVLLGVACALLGLAAFGIYSYFMTKKAQEAQEQLSQNLSEFKKTMQAKPEDQKWDAMAQLFGDGHARYGHTSLGPYFLVYKAQSLLYGGYLEQALDTMDAVMKDLKKSSPLYYLYATKRALIKSDVKGAEGIQELEKLANDLHNPNRDFAAYYAGYYAGRAGDKKKAERFWYALVQQRAEDSPWASLAAKKLATLAS